MEEGKSNEANQAETAMCIVEDVEVKVKPSLSMTQLSGQLSPKETLQQIGQQYKEMEEQISKKEQKICQLSEQTQHLKSELQHRLTSNKQR